jgi:ABC-type cobalamin/Fe3+-siderophores transport system ATPase subunit
MLQASGVSFGYAARRTPAVHEVSIQVSAGSFTGLLGPNGCGKTALLKLLPASCNPRRGRSR